MGHADGNAFDLAYRREGFLFGDEPSEELVKFLSENPTVRGLSWKL
jgi:hypothetical protein